MDKDLEYLIDCKQSETNPSLRSDALRSQLFHLNAVRTQFRRQSSFEGLRHRLLVGLGREVDETRKTYLSDALINSVEAKPTAQPMTGCESHLYSLPKDKLLEVLGIEPKKMSDSSDECSVLRVVMKNPEKNHNKGRKRRIGTNDSRNNGNGGQSNALETKKSSIFNTIGSFGESNGFPSEPPKQPTAKTKAPNPFTSPTKVSGIFRSNATSKVIDVEEDNEKKEQTQKKSTFMTGFQKKVCDDVRNGCISEAAARRALNQFKPPMKASEKPKDEDIDPRLKNIDKHLIESIENEIITKLEPIKSQDVAGLDYAKSKINEIAILPLKKPHLFTGLRQPPKGILLFGPPGTGKTFLGRWIASETKSTFFEITVSTLNSKWIGEGEKNIRAMFAVARVRQPSVIFIDEIDSILKSRNDSEHESSRRMKTEFFTQFEGVSTAMEEQLLIIGATNRPQDLDDAARRRLTARLYISLPDEKARNQLIVNCLRAEKHSLTEEHIQTLAQKTDGYSCADMKLLCSQAAMEAIREMSLTGDDTDETSDHIRDITYEDFISQLDFVKPSVCTEDLQQYEDWDRRFGTNRR